MAGGRAACIRTCWRAMDISVGAGRDHGKTRAGIGNEGHADLRQGILGDLKDGRYGLGSPSAVFGDANKTVVFD